MGAPLVRHRRRRFALVALLLPFAVLAVGEVLVRLVLPPVPSIEVYLRGTPRNPAGEEVGDRVFAGDPLLGWRLRPDLREAFWNYTVFSTNDAGLRYAEPVGRKPPGGLRVLAVGDSVTFGYRVPLAWPQNPRDFDGAARPYPALLEEQLRRAVPGRFVQVIPLAVPGYSSHQGLAWLRRHLALYEPDLVTLCFGWNDIDLRATPDAGSLATGPQHVVARRILAASQLLSHLTLRVDGRRDARAATARIAMVPRVSRENIVDNMLAMARLASEHGARVVILGTVYCDEVTNPPHARRIATWRGALGRAAALANVPYLEIRELTERGASGNADLFGEVIHPNDAGHRLLAARLFAFIRSQELLPVP